jgi:hypothetical protein
MSPRFLPPALPEALHTFFQYLAYLILSPLQEDIEIRMFC